MMLTKICARDRIFIAEEKRASVHISNDGANTDNEKHKHCSPLSGDPAEYGQYSQDLRRYRRGASYNKADVL